jgi:hypothetical protein
MLRLLLGVRQNVELTKMPSTKHFVFTAKEETELFLSMNKILICLARLVLGHKI